MWNKLISLVKIALESYEINKFVDILCVSVCFSSCLNYISIYCNLVEIYEYSLCTKKSWNVTIGWLESEKFQ